MELKENIVVPNTFPKHLEKQEVKVPRGAGQASQSGFNIHLPNRSSELIIFYHIKELQYHAHKRVMRQNQIPPSLS
ncbi:manganese catalase family protein [Cytobacillus firmus]|nr:manganese catalase family protein [Cytobacillus firmus]